jgi:hypothetical protein
MSPTQRLAVIVAANRPHVYGGMRGGFELLAGPSTPQFWKRKAAEGLICLRENRSALQALGVDPKPWAARKLIAIRGFRLKAQALLWASQSAPRASTRSLAAE